MVFAVGGSLQGRRGRFYFLVNVLEEVQGRNRKLDVNGRTRLVEVQREIVC